MHTRQQQRTNLQEQSQVGIIFRKNVSLALFGAQIKTSLNTPGFTSSRQRLEEYPSQFVCWGWVQPTWGEGEGRWNDWGGGGTDWTGANLGVYTWKGPGNPQITKSCPWTVYPWTIACDLQEKTAGEAQVVRQEVKSKEEQVENHIVKSDLCSKTGLYWYWSRLDWRRLRKTLWSLRTWWEWTSWSWLTRWSFWWWLMRKRRILRSRVGDWSVDDLR